MTIIEAAKAVIAHRQKDYLDNTVEPYLSLVKAIDEAEEQLRVDVLKRTI